MTDERLQLTSLDICPTGHGPEIMVENVWKHSTISGGRNVEPGLLLSPSLSRRLRESSVQAMQSRIN
jgi:hypothetical protein